MKTLLVALALMSAQTIAAPALTVDLCRDGTWQADMQTLTFTCVTGAPKLCVISAAPSGPVASGQLVTLAAVCNATLTPVTYAWQTTGGFVLEQATVDVRPITTSTYTVIPRNASGSGQPFSFTVVVQ